MKGFQSWLLFIPYTNEFKYNSDIFSFFHSVLEPNQCFSKFPNFCNKNPLVSVYPEKNPFSFQNCNQLEYFNNFENNTSVNNKNIHSFIQGIIVETAHSITTKCLMCTAHISTCWTNAMKRATLSSTLVHSSFGVALCGSHTVVRYSDEVSWISIETAFRTPSSFRCNLACLPITSTLRNFTAMIKS